MKKIAKVVIDIALDKEFDYMVPPELESEVAAGSRVAVPFGRSRRTGYVVSLSDGSVRSDLKPIHSVTGGGSLISAPVLELAGWIAEYYCSPIEHAVRTVLPSAVRKKGVRFKERLWVELTGEGLSDERREAMAKRAPKQAAMLDLLAGGGRFLSDVLAETETSAAAAKALEKKGLVAITSGDDVTSPFKNMEVVRTEPFKLMPDQEKALELAAKSVDTLDPRVILLHGVTGSGKTEVYMQAISRVLEKGKGAIVLVPEISLTPQTVERFRGRFGDVVAVLHSHLSEAERHGEWHRLHKGEARIAVGARSAVFAPVADLGLIVVDEEHDTSYKQDESPRYHARDVAVMRGVIEKCSVILGSATPSCESYLNSRNGKYELMDMPNRVDHRKMPVMRIIDMRIEAQREGRANVFSRELIEGIGRRLDRSEQTILFLNRRGYATSLICPKCGDVATCTMCNIAFTYHRHTDRLACHICGSGKMVPSRCSKCGDPSFKFSGIGTQRVERIVHKIFPKARIARMDSDSTGRKGSHDRILGDFRTGKTDILVGTQMIAKGLDFPNVTLIGVVYADLSLHMPDFRASERTFQLLTQVAGRAGRGDVPGEVIVQTYTPFNIAVQCARRLDYEGFQDQEFEGRRELKYPPFAHLVCLTARGRAESEVSFALEAFSRDLKKLVADNVVVAGPVAAPMAKAKGFFRYQLMLRARSARAMVQPIRSLLKTFKWPGKVTCSVDVDAISLM